MARIKVRFYLDVAATLRDCTPEERERIIKEEEEKSKKLTEWPKL